MSWTGRERFARGARRLAARPALALALGLVLVLTALIAPGCASNGAEGGRAPFAELHIDNDNPRIVTVYAVRNGTRMRLGTVNGVSSHTFPLRQSMIGSTGQLRVLVEPLGSNNRYFSDPIFVNEGDVIELTVSGLVR